MTTITKSTPALLQLQQAVAGTPADKMDHDEFGDRINSKIMIKQTKATLPNGVVVVTKDVDYAKTIGVYAANTVGTATIGLAVSVVTVGIATLHYGNSLFDRGIDRAFGGDGKAGVLDPTLAQTIKGTKDVFAFWGETLTSYAALTAKTAALALKDG